MVFKAQIYVESRFDNKAVACPNLPCGTPSGWTAAERAVTCLSCRSCLRAAAL